MPMHHSPVVAVLQSNRITRIENLDALVNLEDLYLSHNGIERMEGLGALVRATCAFSWLPLRDVAG